MGLLLALAGAKIFYNVIFGKIDPMISLAVTLSVLIGGVSYSLWRTRKAAKPDAAEPASERLAQ